jgi:hypothetical protein
MEEHIHSLETVLQVAVEQEQLGEIILQLVQQVQVVLEKKIQLQEVQYFMVVAVVVVLLPLEMQLVEMVVVELVELQVEEMVPMVQLIQVVELVVEEEDLEISAEISEET